MEQLEKKYGLFTAICMVVGIVIGSGIFFKAQTILEITNGNMPLGILAWVIGGIMMIILAVTFGEFANKYEKVNGLMDYAEMTCGRSYSYFFGWFLGCIYYPTLTGIVGWLCARYFGELFGLAYNSNVVFILSFVFLVFSYSLNILSPKLAGKFQISSTIIKMIPLVMMAVVGTIYGMCKNVVIYEVVNECVVLTRIENVQILFTNFASAGSFDIQLFFKALVAVAFAYEGWICATAINTELKDSKRNLPLALFVGTIIIAFIYLVYYIGLSGGAFVDVLRYGGAMYAFTQVFGNFIGVILRVFIIISCMGTLNGLSLAASRSFHALALNNTGFYPDVFKKVSSKSKSPMNSAIVAFLLSAIWITYYFGAQLSSNPWFHFFVFDASELPIVLIYGFYIPMLLCFMIKEKSLHPFMRFVLPSLSLVCCIFMLVSGIIAHGISFFKFLLVVFVIMLVGLFIYLKKKQYRYELY